jgi:uncharacterized protein (TIGR02186 family)
VIFGTKREKGDIAITVSGPTQTMMVRRKQQILGIWVNGKALRFEDIPSYYDVALSEKESDLAPLDILSRNEIGLNGLQLYTNENEDIAVIDTFRDALIRNKQRQGLFPLEPRQIIYLSENFFRANFYLPANVPTGIYKVRTFLINGGNVVDSRENEIKVAQTGFSAKVFLFAKTHSLPYGMVAVLMALFFGWGAYAVFRRE